MRECLDKRPPSHTDPWRLALYSDEVTPGNVLAAVQRRKVWVIYWSFLELGHYLHHEDVWLPMVAVPPLSVKKVSAGISQVFCQAIKFFFGMGPGGHDLRAGIRLQGPDGAAFRLVATLSMFLQDGGAQKLVWWCKSDSGTRPCMLCKKLVAPGSLPQRREGFFVDDSVSDALQLTSNDGIQRTL